MCIDNLLDRTWSVQYTCNEFACEAWEQLTGECLSQRMQDFFNGKSNFEELSEPCSPCIVFFTNNNETPTHVGVFYVDRVLHLTGRGVHYMPLEFISGFKEVRFYK